LLPRVTSCAGCGDANLVTRRGLSGDPNLSPFSDPNPFLELCFYLSLDLELSLDLDLSLDLGADPRAPRRGPDCPPAQSRPLAAGP
jgi:hypothetical protein